MDPLTVGSLGLSALGSLLSGINANSAAKARAAQLQAAGLQARNEAGVAAGLALGQGEATEARAATQAAANGGGLGGSSMAVLTDLSDQALYNARAAVYSGATEASQDDYQAAVTKAQGGMALTQGVFGAGSSLLGGFVQDAAFKRAEAAGLRLRGGVR